MISSIVLIFSGLILSLLLFYYFPTLKNDSGVKCSLKISVIIPARNEEINLPLILQDLKNQNFPIYEIICVDDESVDDTAKIAQSFGVKLIKITDKPADWTGKSWACQKGANSATGELLLFLDADVRLGPDAISSLIKTYEENKCVVSVAPYHMTNKFYEQFSLFFNLIQIPANATSTLIKFKNAGLYGPVILIHKETYLSVEGHNSAKNSIVDDLALGEKLTQKGHSFKLFLGASDISFRMYSGGFSDLLHGWTKNYATGALKTQPLLFLFIFVWVASCISTIILPIQAIITNNWLYLFIFIFAYAFWVLEINRISRKIGHFKPYTPFCFPLYMAVFLYVFLISFIKKFFHLNVIWKDRKIKLEK